MDIADRRPYSKEIFIFGQRFDPYDVFENMDFEVYQSLTERQKQAIVEALEITLLNYYAMTEDLPPLDEEEPAAPAPPSPIERLQRAIAGEEPRKRRLSIEEARRRRLRGQ
mgnify:CR=1 FL=1|jgi:hypothetical protein